MGEEEEEVQDNSADVTAAAQRGRTMRSRDRGQYAKGAAAARHSD